jgi:CRISPR/Cas system-associated exonuclease Cas4 (RecB family)
MNDRTPIGPTTNYLSVSRINTFLRCPRQYFLKYAERVPPDFRTTALAFGTAWHDATREYFASRGALNLDDLVAVFAKSFDEQLEADEVPVLFEATETRDELVAKARLMLLAFVRRVPIPEAVLDLERAFSLDLRHPVTGELLTTPVVGSIDAIIRRNGSIIVLELKSAKRRWGPDQIAWDSQTTAYLIAARQLGYETPAAELVVTTKARRPDVQIERLARHRRDEAEFAELVSGVLGGIRAGIEIRNRGWQCRTCAWLRSCA